jgi:hypothetical protein
VGALGLLVYAARQRRAAAAVNIGGCKGRRLSIIEHLYSEAIAA